MRRSVSSLALAALILLASAAVAAAAGSLADVIVIVHPSQDVSSITTADLTKLFLKKTPKWGNGSAVAPVDQAAEAPVRALFSELVLGKKVAAVSSYWQQQVFSGQGIPPEVKPGDAEVLSYVKANPGAIGYLSAGAATDGVKVLTVTK